MYLCMYEKGWARNSIMILYNVLQYLVILFQVLGILCMSLASPWYSTWFVFVAVTSFITTLMWSFVFLLSIKDALKLPINWVLSVSKCIIQNPKAKRHVLEPTFTHLTSTNLQFTLFTHYSPRGKICGPADAKRSSIK